MQCDPNGYNTIQHTYIYICDTIWFNTAYMSYDATWCTRWMWLYACIIWINTLRHEKHKRFTDWYLKRGQEKREESNWKRNFLGLCVCVCVKCSCNIWKSESERGRRIKTTKITWFKEKYYFEHKIKSYINCFLCFLKATYKIAKRQRRRQRWRRVHRPFDRCDCTILIAAKRFVFDIYTAFCTDCTWRKRSWNSKDVEKLLKMYTNTNWKWEIHKRNPPAPAPTTTTKIIPIISILNLERIAFRAKLCTPHSL